MVYTKAEIEKLILPMLQSMPKGDEEAVAKTITDLVFDNFKKGLDEAINSTLDHFGYNCEGHNHGGRS